MKIIETQEILVDGVMHTEDIYDSGHIVKYQKTSNDLVEHINHEPTQLDLIQQAVEKSNDELRQEGAEAVTLELIERGVL